MDNDTNYEMYEHYRDLDPKGIIKEIYGYAAERIQIIMELMKEDEALKNNTITDYCDDIGENNEPIGLCCINAKEYFGMYLQDEIDDLMGELKSILKDWEDFE